MNGYESEEGFGSVAELLEDIESDESDETVESDENVRNLSRRLGAIKPKLAGGAGLFKQRVSQQYVTQTQLQAALARVGGQIKTNAEATKAIGTRVNSLNSRIDAEISTRRKENTAIRGDIKRARESSILPLLLTKPPKLTKLTIGADGAIVNQEYDKQDNLLPLVLLMGMGGSGDGKGDENNMLLMAMLLMNR